MSTRRQQEQVYAAEAALRSHGRRFKDVRAIQAYLDTLTGSDWWIDRYPTTPRVLASRMSSKRWAGVASAKDPHITIAYGSAEEAVVLHEVAHVLTPTEEHSPVFCFTLLDLVRENMGFHAYGALLSAFRSAGCLDGRHLG